MRASQGECEMKRNRIVLVVVIALLAFGSAFTQGDIPTPTADQQTQFQVAMKELKMRRQTLQSAATTKLSLVNCGQLMLAQSQLETADVRMQLVLTKISGQLGLDSGVYEAVEDKNGKLVFHHKDQALSPVS